MMIYLTVPAQLLTKSIHKLMLLQQFKQTKQIYTEIVNSLWKPTCNTVPKKTDKPEGSTDL